MPSPLTRELASRFAGIALNHVTREYPGQMDHVLSGPQDVQSPRALHPAFYGSFDWHSCVHGFWLLARLLRLFPDLPQAVAIHALFDEQLTPANIAGELRYLQRPLQDNFERPYGWAWLLALGFTMPMVMNKCGNWKKPSRRYRTSDAGAYPRFEPARAISARRRPPSRTVRPAPRCRRKLR